MNNFKSNLIDSAFYLLISFTPLILTIILNAIFGAPLIGNYIFFQATVASTCIPIIALGFYTIDWSRLKTPGGLIYSWQSLVHLIAFLLAFVPLLLSSNSSISDNVKGKWIAWLIWIIMVLSTMFSTFLQKDKERGDAMDQRKNESDGVKAGDMSV